MNISCSVYLEHSSHGFGPYILLKVTLDHTEVPTADTINEFAKVIVDAIVSMFPIASQIKSILERIYKDITPTIAGHDNGNGTIVEVRAPFGGAGVPYSKVYPRDNSRVAAPTEDGIVLFKDSFYRGSWVHFYNTDIPHLSDYGFNDKVSSIQINGALAFIAYKDADYNGRALLVNGSMPQTSKYGFHDSISSIKSFQPSKAITVYKDINYDGVSSFHTSSIEHTSSVGLNDEISSIMLHYGAKCRIYKDADFRGSSIELTGSCPRLSELGFNDKVSSIRIY